MRCRATRSGDCGILCAFAFILCYGCSHKTQIGTGTSSPGGLVHENLLGLFLLRLALFGCILWVRKDGSAGRLSNAPCLQLSEGGETYVENTRVHTYPVGRSSGGAVHIVRSSAAACTCRASRIGAPVHVDRINARDAAQVQLCRLRVCPDVAPTARAARSRTDLLFQTASLR